MNIQLNLIFLTEFSHLRIDLVNFLYKKIITFEETQYGRKINITKKTILSNFF